jgi:hypothetical protein
MNKKSNRCFQTTTEFWAGFKSIARESAIFKERRQNDAKMLQKTGKKSLNAIF